MMKIGMRPKVKVEKRLRDENLLGSQTK